MFSLPDAAPDKAAGGAARGPDAARRLRDTLLRAGGRFAPRPRLAGAGGELRPQHIDTPDRPPGLDARLVIVAPVQAVAWSVHINAPAWAAGGAYRCDPRGVQPRRRRDIPRDMIAYGRRLV